MLKGARALFLEIPESDEMLAWVQTNLEYCEENQKLGAANEALSSIDALIQEQRFDEAEESIVKAIRGARRTLKVPGAAGRQHWMIAALLSRRAYALMAEGRHSEALPVLEEAQEAIAPWKESCAGEVACIESNLRFCHDWLGY